MSREGIYFIFIGAATVGYIEVSDFYMCISSFSFKQMNRE